VREFYSIAEHLCLVHDLVKQWFNAADIICLSALFHDAAEYACQDLTAPLKWTLRQMDRMSDGSPGWRSDYDKVEDTLMRRICLKYGVSKALMDHEFVRTADLWAMRIEAHQLTASGGSEWRYPLPLPNDGKIPDDIGWMGGRAPRSARRAWCDRVGIYKPDLINRRLFEQAVQRHRPNLRGR
jgi:hypothetical protein